MNGKKYYKNWQKEIDCSFHDCRFCLDSETKLRLHRPQSELETAKSNCEMQNLLLYTRLTRSMSIIVALIAINVRKLALIRKIRLPEDSLLMKDPK
jgi:hypothetical protein